MRQPTAWSVGHRCELLQGALGYFQHWLKKVELAQSRVWLETYIFHWDATGEQVAAALESAALRGLDVRLMMDGVGTPVVPTVWAQRWAAAGVRWHRYLPLGTWGWLLPSRWRRLHRKLAVVDQAWAWCGGVNVLDDHADPQWGPQAEPRFDFCLGVQGPVVQDVAQTMDAFWNAAAPGTVAQALGRVRSRAAQVVSKAHRWALGPSQTVGDDSLQAGLSQNSGVRLALVLRDNWRFRRRIEMAYRMALSQARQEVLIANAYCLPGRRLRRAMADAVKRGVKVRLLVQGRYEYFMQFHASRPLLGQLIRQGVEVWEYQPAFLHAKVAVVDARWMTVGSSNLDPLSLLLAREANFVVDDAALATTLRDALEQARQTQALPLEWAQLQQRPWWERLLDWVGYALLRMALFILGRRY